MLDEPPLIVRMRGFVVSRTTRFRQHHLSASLHLAVAEQTCLLSTTMSNGVVVVP